MIVPMGPRARIRTKGCAMSFTLRMPIDWSSLLPVPIGRRTPSSDTTRRMTPVAVTGSVEERELVRLSRHLRQDIGLELAPATDNTPLMVQARFSSRL